ncbi:MAG: YbaK/EbsC family protein [Candidatus Aenigmarchaeota archaeon]|nr:YbaK/EbsC family protein [Candidatus Aenigmarchaeota archaeon]
MQNCEEKIINFIKNNKIRAGHIKFDNSVHSVQDVLKFTNIKLDEISKSIVFKNDKEIIVGVVLARYRVSSTRIGKLLNIEPPTICDSAEAFEKTGYPVGGMPCFGYDAIFVLDDKLKEVNHIYTGGGSEFSLVKISIDELKRVNKFIVGNIRGNKSN